MNNAKANFSLNNIKEKFEVFNRQFFQGRLTQPNFKVTCSRTRLGVFSVRKYGTLLTISISNYWDVTETEMNTTLIHEMIHLWQYSILHSSGGHGDTFKNKAKDIYEKSKGLYNITRTTSRSGCSLSKEGTEKEDRLKNKISRKPIIMMWEQETVENGETVIIPWMFRLSRPMYERMFKYSGGGLKGNKKSPIKGFIYNKSKDWVAQTQICKSKLLGKRFRLQEYKQYAEMIEKEITMDYLPL